MVHIRRHRARDISPAVPSGRRIRPWWPALALAIVCTASLVGLFSSHGSAVSPRAPVGDPAALGAVTLAAPGATPASMRPALDPTPTAGPTTSPPTRLGLNLGFNLDSDDALRPPDPGSVPSAQPLARSVSSTSTAAPEAEPTTDQWSFLHRAATGQWLFLTGFLMLLLSIGGLVTVGIYRRRW